MVCCVLAGHNVNSRRAAGKAKNRGADGGGVDGPPGAFRFGPKRTLWHLIFRVAEFPVLCRKKGNAWALINDDEFMETLLSVCLGIGLSAACGFRVFVPLLALSIASHAGHVQLAAGFQWIATDAALVSFAVATVLEIAAYYIPWVDHALDVVAAPAAVVAGILVTGSLITDMSPLLKWTLAVIAGGGAAGIVQGGTMLLRGTSSATTAGFGNPIVATVELAGATAVSVLSLLAPMLITALLLVLMVWVGRTLWLRSLKRVSPPAHPTLS
jgi:hypothetical protein